MFAIILHLLSVRLLVLDVRLIFRLKCLIKLNPIFLFIGGRVMGPFLFFLLFSNFMLVRKCVQNIERMSYELVAYPQLPQPVDVMHLFCDWGLRARLNTLSLLSS